MKKYFFMLIMFILVSGCTINDTVLNDVNNTIFHAGDFKVYYPSNLVVEINNDRTEFLFKYENSSYPFVKIYSENISFNSIIEYQNSLLSLTPYYSNNTTLGGVNAILSKYYDDSSYYTIVTAEHEGKYYSVLNSYELNESDFFNTIKTSFAYQTYTLNNDNRIVCDAMNYCPDEFGCYLFENETYAYCYLGNPCDLCDSKDCVLLESYPIQVRCQ